MIKCISVLSDAQLWHVRHFCVKKRSEWILICEGYEPNAIAMPSQSRAASLPPAPCPFWSNRIQADFELDRMRPAALGPEETPCPADEWDGESPKPLQEKPSGEDVAERTPGVYETPNSRNRSEPKPDDESRESAAVEEVENKEEPRRPERSWRRRVGAGEERPQVIEEEPPMNSNGTGSSLEEALSAEIAKHFQNEMAKLKATNEMLAKKVIALEHDRGCQAQHVQPAPPMPPSWNAQLRDPTTPPRETTPAQSSVGAWVSPDTFRTTPNGTRVPAGPPPPDPPDLPDWPLELQGYEVVNPPRKLRGVMGDPVYKVASDVCSPQEARNFWLEREILELKNFVQEQAWKNDPKTYWQTPFLSESERDRELSREVASLRRNVGLPSAGSSALGAVPRDGLPLQDRADVHRDAAALGGQCHEARANSSAFVLGGEVHGHRASIGASELGGEVHGSRASTGAAMLGGEVPGYRALHTMSAGQDEMMRGRPWTSSMEGTMDDRLRRGRSASRGDRDRDVVEDGDLKSIPVTLPSLPPPEGRDASLEAGDWLIQLEPLIGDLSKNALMWWRQIMAVTSHRYMEWLHADPLDRLRIGAPSGALLPPGYERLDQRVTTLLLQAVPRCIKDEVVATRELSTVGILYKVFRTFQPGGLGERSRLLEDLTLVPKVTSAQDVVSALRLWKRKANRALELQAQLPDAMLMIRTLDGITKPLLDGMQQSTFRIATFRMNHALDVRPTLTNVWLFYDLLLSEAELAVHSSTGTSLQDKPTSKSAVKALQPEGGKTSDTPPRSPMWPCKFWLTESGCRQGGKCRWPHPWEGVADKAARCWTCSSLQHQQQDCPARAQPKPPVGGEGDGKKETDVRKEGKGKGKSKGKDKGGKNDGKSGSKEGGGEEKREEKPVTKTAEEAKPKPTGGTGATGDGKEGGSGGTAELLQEATKLLKSLHLPTVKVVSLQELDAGLDDKSGQVLLDSGATHVLRKAKDQAEWEAAKPTVVALAQGTTSSLRLKAGTSTLLVEPQDGKLETGILPMGALPRIGYDVSWSGGRCTLISRDGPNIELEVVNGCPLLEHAQGMELIEKFEKENQMDLARVAMMKAVMGSPELLKEVEAADPMLTLAVMLKKEYPDLPDKIINKIIPRWREVKGENLPWNRRQGSSIGLASLQREGSEDLEATGNQWYGRHLCGSPHWPQDEHVGWWRDDVSPKVCCSR